MSSTLPIVPYLSTIQQHLLKQDVILTAAPGTGKSTALLLHLLKTYRADSGKIVVLEPRRVIVRALAQFLAAELEEQVGESIGYRIRGETKVSKSTVLEIVTEAVLTRRFQADPEISDIGLIVFDEFHERNIHSDFSLALAIECQLAFREDLRLLVMSATLDIDAITRLLPNAACITVPGRQYPVDTYYHPLTSDMQRNQTLSRGERVIQKIESILPTVLITHFGDVLIFLPGAREIKRLHSQLQSKLANDTDMTIVPLMGMLSKQQQQDAISPDKAGRRKIVLATNIAESSLTIDGISIVIDSGLERRLLIDSRSGIEQLVTVAISQASAEQRAGRAGRQRHGYCYRLWSEDSHSRLAKQSPPSMLTSDVTDLALYAKAWGCELTSLPLIDPPTEKQYVTAIETLHELGTMDGSGKLNKHGHSLLSLPFPIRYAHMLLTVDEWFPRSSVWLHSAAIVIWLHEQGNFSSPIVSDILSELMVAHMKSSESRLNSILRSVNHSFSGATFKKITSEQLSICIGLARPEWLAKSVGNGSYKLASGKQAKLVNNLNISPPEWISISDLSANDSGEILVRQFEPISEESLERYFKNTFVHSSEWYFDAQTERCQLMSVRRFGKIVLSKGSESLSSLSESEKQQKLAMLWKAQICKQGIAWLAMNNVAMQTLKRCQIYAQHVSTDKEFPDYSETELLRTLEQWCLPHVCTFTHKAKFATVNWEEALMSRLSWEQQQIVNKELPLFIILPTGDKATIDYSTINASEPLDNQVASVSVRMQHVFGMSKSPKLAQGKLTLRFELLSPAMRPVQTTSDLAAFWKSDSYIAVKKEMRGRYPKHIWPDDPANTAPTKKTKRHIS